jgi:20S proteasome alpha/beta subunit
MCLLARLACFNFHLSCCLSQARIECQSYRLTVEDAPSVEYVARHIGTTQQKYTQRGGVRPFGLSLLIAGIDSDGKPQLWSTDPSGVYSAWKANAIGRNSKSLLEMLEKQYKDGMSTEEATRLAIKALLEIVESGAKSMEVAVMGPGFGKGMSMMEEKDIGTIVDELEKEKAEAAEAAGAEAARMASVTAGAGRM